jgi:hypothetical protein
MATIVEDGSIVDDANSYVSDADFDTYATDHGAEVEGIAAELLLNAARYVEQLPFIGTKQTQAQEMQWPRFNVYIDGFLLGNTEIPKLLRSLQCEVALAIDAGDDPLGTVERAVKREKVDVIEVEYANNAAPFAYNLKIKALERKLTSIRGGISFQVSRV